MIQSATTLPNDQFVAKQLCIMIVGTDPLMMRLGKIVNFDPNDLAIQIRHKADGRVYESLKTNARCVSIDQPLPEVQLAIATIQLLLDAPMANGLTAQDLPCGVDSPVKISVDLDDEDEIEVRVGPHCRRSKTKSHSLESKLKDVKQKLLQMVVCC